MEIRREKDISYNDFLHHYAKPQIPVILTDAAKEWESALSWTPESMKERFGSREFEISGKQTKFADFIDEVLQSSEENPAPYFHNIELNSNFPELVPEVPYFKYAQKDRVESKFLSRQLMETGWYELFIGGPGGQFPYLHTDFKGVFSWITQLYGDKELIFYSPDQKEFMHPRETNERRSYINAFEPDYEKFPLFANAKPVRCVLKQGESLFVPPEWWHTARMLTPSIAVVSAHITSSNWKNFVRDEFRRRRSTAIPFCAYLIAVGAILSLIENMKRKSS